MGKLFLYLNVIIISFFISSNLFAITNEDIIIKKSSDSELTFELTPNLINIKSIKTSNNFDVAFPIFENSEIKKNANGSPIEIVRKVLIAVSDYKNFAITKNIQSNIKYIHSTIAPNPELSIETDIKNNSYLLDETIYNNSEIDGKWAKIMYDGIASDLHVAEIEIVLAKYNPITKNIEIPQSHTITINFPKIVNSFKSNTSLRNIDFLLNSEQAKNWVIKPEISSDKFNYEKLLSEDNNKISEISNGTWAKITISESGIYKITASQIASLGFNVTPENINTIKIFGKGGIQLDEKVSSALKNYLDEQEIIVNKNSNGSLESIVFFGAGTKGFHKTESGISSYFNEYTNSSYYLITMGGKDGLRAVALQNSPETPVNSPTTYTQRIFFDEDINNPYQMGAGRQWFGRSYFSSPFLNQFPNLVREGNILYRLAVAHRSFSISGLTDGSAYFNFYENNNLLGKIDLTGHSTYTESIWGTKDFVSPAKNTTSDNRSLLKFEYMNIKNPNGATPYFDFFEIHYPREFFAINNEVEFIADTNLIGLTEFKINGYSGDIFGFDISNPASPKYLTNKSNTGGLFIFNSQLSKNDYQRYYISSNIKTPKLEKISFKSLREKFANADVIVITHSDLLASAEKFKTYRESNSDLKVSVFTTEDIYNEFGCGSPDLTAIRDFIAYSYKNWTIKPRYLFLWGDGHYDFKNVSTNRTNYVPAYQVPDFGISTYNTINESFCTDDFYGRISGEDSRIDLSIGRMPADSPEMGLWLANKIEHYEQKSSKDNWRTNVILVADDGPQGGTSNDGNAHSGDSENLSRLISSDLQQEKIYMVEYPLESTSGGRKKPLVTQDLLTAINTRGSLILNWYGHGNPRVWSHEGILDRETTIPQMRNLDKLFFLTAATCDYGRFDLTDLRSGSEEMLYSKVGGAIAVLAFTRVVYINDNSAVNLALFSNMFKREIATGKYLRLGDAMYNVKQTYTGIGDQKFVILGDPTMHLLLPDYKIEIDSINGIDISNLNKPLELKGLSKVQVKARVINPLTNETATDFNGSVIVTMRDGDQYYEILEKDPWGGSDNLFIFNKFGGALNKSSAVVTNGNIISEFIIPKDISFSDSTGRLFIYAYDTTKVNYAKGSTRNFIVNGIDGNQNNDGNGPLMEIFLDSKNFVNNDLVSSSPLLLVDFFDENGINTTGLGIGHRIEAWLDDNAMPIDLTNKFATSTVDARYGSAQDVLYNLKEGMHRIKVRSWDVFNNFSVKEIYFRVANVNGSPVISNIQNYPNPFEYETVVRFQHNITPPFEAELKVYNSLGVLIKSIQQRLGTLYNSEILWDGKDDNGNLCPVGAYYYSITASNKISSATSFGTISVMFR